MPAESAAKTPPAQTHAFQTEVQQLLHLIIHSLYSEKEIFLRELISNASDACDRLRFAALTDASLRDSDEELGIWIEADAKRRTLTVRDNGIGMSRDEVIENIGTIARSGTRAFLDALTKEQARDSALIGQFGVGFYSAFLVAKEVTLLTRRAGAPADAGVKWTSDGGGEYRVEPIERAARGTEIILQLQRGENEFLDRHRLRAVIAKYSDHISLPIRMLEQPPAGEGGDDGDGKAAQPQPEWETINQGSALWARAKKDISADEYNAFYTALTYDPEPPAITLHNRVEGKMEYISLLYVPAKAPFDLWDREQRRGIKLYVRRIFIAEDAKRLMPNYLRFVRGLVDSADLPLNVSREFLQQNAGIDKIRAASVKKVLAELARLANKKPDQYAALWREYGRVIKEGMVEDFDNRKTIAELLRFASTHSDSSAEEDDKDAQSVSLADYIARMPEAQKAIYYVTADSLAAARSSPHLEVFAKNGIEVLLLFDPVDEWVVGHLAEHDGKPLQSIAKGDLDPADLPGAKAADDAGDGKGDAAADESSQLQPLVDKLQAALEGKVKAVRLSSRLVDSPACLVADQHDLGANMERILQAVGQDAPRAKPILEINPRHAIVRQIDAEDALADDWAQVLFDHAALAEGAPLADSGGYVKRINKLLAR